MRKGGEGRSAGEAQAVTPGAVRCSEWFGDVGLYDAELIVESYNQSPKIVPTKMKQ